MIIEQWTFIIMMSSIAYFPSADFTREWLYLPGPYATEVECRKALKKEPEEIEHSQCMPWINARAISLPYNKGAFVLVHPKSKANLVTKWFINNIQHDTMYSIKK